jgi:hypothetical protein
VLENLAFGFVGLVGVDPQPGERGVDVVVELFGQRHEKNPFL